jgi:hypothetical protein
MAGDTSTHDLLTPETVRPFLVGCGYQPQLLLSHYEFGTARDVDLVAFAHQPVDMRSVCLAAISAQGDVKETVVSYRQLGAPVVFVCHDRQLQWWRQGIKTPRHLITVEASDLPGFFQQHQQDFSPEVIYRAKTWGRFEPEQLSFVDAGLMPLVEEEMGQALSGLVERVVRNLVVSLHPARMTVQLGQWLFRTVFWLLAAKILRDKQVPSFESLDLTDIDDVLARIANHYGSSLSRHGLEDTQRQALVAASHTLARFSHLGHVTTESLAYVYENTLISKEMRAQLGIYSTPSYLVDYMIWRLAPWIEAIPEEDRHIFEPACGHPAFLVSAMRLLRVLRGTTVPTRATRAYLRQRLHGIEIDPFALEIARLALTLADVPHPDGWDLRPADMFVGHTLEQIASRSMVLLANPPFENFKRAERDRYAQQDTPPTYMNKAAEMLHRTLSHLRPGAVFGVVVPQGLLHSKHAADLRAFILRNFAIDEICLFPDKVFAFSDMESAIVLGRRVHEAALGGHRVHYRQVREPDMRRFRAAYVATSDRPVPQRRFADDPVSVMRLPELEDVWEWCQSLPRFEHFAKIGQGLMYKSQNNLPVNAQTVSSNPFPGAVHGFARLTPDLHTDGQPPEVWMSIDPAVIRRPMTGTTIGVPQVLLNYAPVSRSPWRLKAIMDRAGHAVTSRFLTIRPLSESTPLEFFWALCNSPFANAFTYTHSEKRDILAGTVRAMPVPHTTHAGIQRVVEAARAYLVAIAPLARETWIPALDEDASRELLKRVDAEILRLYDLPPRLERQMLDLFSGWQRPGVPFDFKRYFPEDFAPCLPLHMYLSEPYRHSTAGALRARYEPVTEPAILAALERAVEDFEE